MTSCADWRLLENCLISVQLFGWRGCPLLLQLGWIADEAQQQKASAHLHSQLSSCQVCECQWTRHIKKISYWQTALIILIINANWLPIQCMLQLRALVDQMKWKSAPPSRLGDFYKHTRNLRESASVGWNLDIWMPPRRSRLYQQPSTNMENGHSQKCSSFTFDTASHYSQTTTKNKTQVRGLLNQRSSF